MLEKLTTSSKSSKTEGVVMKIRKFGAPHLCAMLALVHLPCASLASAAQKPTPFKDGIEAMERERWHEMADRMREALEKNPKEDGKNIRVLTGNQTRPYLPYYYLGIALSMRGRCEEAKEAWNTSESHGAIQNRRQEHKDMRKRRDKCT